MKKSLEIDVGDLTDILETLTKRLDKMSEPDLIDLAARLKPAAKHCKTIDDYVKGVIKEKLKDKEGVRLGGLFKAVLKVITSNRFNQSKLKADDIELYDAYCESKDEARITFEVR